MTPRYLVTGCAGFIGSRVTELLLDAGCEVVGIDNFNDAYDPVLKRWRMSRVEGVDGFELARIDVRDRAAVRGLLGSGFDAVVHLAARAGVPQSLEDPWAYYETNVTGTLNLLDACRESGVPKLVLASTSSVYGLSDRMPFREDAPTDMPVSPYAASKKAAESLCYTYHHLHGTDVTVLRYFTVYGPAGRPDLSLFRFVKWISEGEPVTVYGDGSRSRDFTYVDDIARGTVAALKPVGYEVVNLGSDSPVTVSSAIATIEELVGREANVVHEPELPTDVPATWADIGKAETLLGWRPERTLAEGLAESVRWYRENRRWARDVATG